MLFKAISYLLLGICLLLNAASAQERAEPQVRIAWDYSSMQQIAERGGYPRLKRLQDGSVCVIYETYTGNIHLKRSFDNGSSWEQPQQVFSQFTYTAANGESTLVNMSNPEIIQLKNGDIIIACNYRPQTAEIAPYSIAIRRSTDNRRSWLPPQVLYNAAPRFRDGCWEPSFLQLPDGTLQIYFANEYPYQQSEEQEISMLSSTDNGITWSSKCATVSFRKNRRDGMPVPILAGKDIVVAIEDNNETAFRPYTVRTPISEGWRQVVSGNSARREYALKHKVPDSVYMGAPYLLMLAGGQTLLSYQTTEGRTSEWERSAMEVTIGDSEARNFQYPSRPFPVPLEKEAKWNSLALWDSVTVAALTSGNFLSKHISPWLIKGYIIPQSIHAGESADKLPVFVGATTSNNLRIGVSKSGNDVTIRCKASGPEMLNTKSRSEIYIVIEGMICKASVSAEGAMQFYKQVKGRWKKSRSLFKMSLKKEQDGYTFDLTMTVPPHATSLRLGAGLIIHSPEGVTEERLVQMDASDPDTWVRFSLPE